MLIFLKRLFVPRKISHKIWFSIAILLTAYFITTALSFVFKGRIQRKLKEIGICSELSTEAGRDLTYNLNEQMKLYQDAVMISELSLVDEADRHSKLVVASLNKLSGIIFNTRETNNMIFLLKEKIIQYVKEARPVYSALSNEDESLAIIEHSIKLAQKKKIMTYLAVELTSMVARDLTNAMSTMSLAIEKQKLVEASLVFVAFILSIAAVMFIINNFITLPLRAIIENVKDIAREDNDMLKYVQVTTNDEVAELAGWFNTYVDKRTAELRDTNQTLQQTLETQQKTQDKLVEIEKMAALGSLVAGVAHEINTPVGVGVTGASYLEEESQHITEKYSEGNLKGSELETYLKTVTTTSTSILSNLLRAGELIKSFKQVAVDQSHEERRKFKIKKYIKEVLVSLRPKYKNSGHTIEIICHDNLEINSYPGSFSQIITNFVMNSLIHAFDGIEKGIMLFDVSIKEGELLFKYKDNGHGIDEENLKMIFEPFYTTKRNQGGTGLGMHIVYNLVTQTLGGQIECTSSFSTGTTFLIRLPIQQENNDE